MASLNRILDDSLGRSAKGDDRHQLGELLDGLRQYLLLIANQELNVKLKSKVAPSDLVQETFRKAQEAFDVHKCLTKEELRAWLRQILINHCHEVHRAYLGTRKRDPRRELSLSGFTDSGISALVDCIMTH